MTTRVTTLFLDIGGVLLTNGWDGKARRRAAETFHLDVEEMDQRHHLTFDTYEEGKLSLNEYLSRVVFHRERSFSLEDFRRFMFAQSRPLPDMIELVCRLKRRHDLKIAAVSNEGRELTEYRVREFQLGSFIDFFIASSFVHFRKPDTDIYCMALDIAQVKPAEVAYLDDRPMFVEVARSLGINGIIHSGCDSSARELANFGLDL
jgi:putative hydrolase of the HAD superfamily